QAHWMQRRYIGFELKDEYCEMFEAKVLLAIGREWTARKEIRERRERARNRLEEAIRNLRQLKFAVALTKQIAKESRCKTAELGINTLFVISDLGNGKWPLNESDYLRETVVMILDEGV